MRPSLTAPAGADSSVTGTAVQMCSDSLPPAASAATKLKQALAPVEWAVLSCALHVIKLALAPSAVESNKHTAASLAAYFAEAWFPPIDLQVCSALRGVGVT